MARRARLRLEGLPLHVVQRGNNKGACFFGDEDRLLYLSLLEELAPRHACEVHAYVLMSNHVHLLLTPREAGAASWLMKNLGQRYVQAVNRRRRRSGSLWEGRFRSSLVDTDTYLLRCQRYIELNPVRASMVERAGEYPWSSFAANALGVPTRMLCPHPVYVGLGAEPEARRERYRALFADGMPEEQLQQIRDAVNGGFALGTPAFVAELEKRLARRARPGISGRPRERS